MVGVCRPVLQILTLFQTKKRYFSHQSSEIHTHSHNWALKIMSSLLIRWEQQQKRFSPLKSKQLGSYTPVVPLKTIPDFRPEWVKSITLFRPKGRKNPTLWGTHTYMAYIGEYPPRVQKRGLCATSQLNFSGRGAPYNYDKKNSSRKCCTALCNNRSGGRKDLLFHVFPNDPCRNGYG